MLIHLHQMRIDALDFPGNGARILRLFRDSEADLSVFPEACTSGYSFSYLKEVAAFNGEFLVRAREETKNRERGLILPLLAEDGGRYFNRTYCLGPDGEILGTYDKIHMIGVLEEDRYLSPGTEPGILDFPSSGGRVRLGLATCYDIRFPELFRRLVLREKADLLILPALWPSVRKEHLRILARARALENQIPLLAVNATGSCGSLELGGESAIVSETGSLLGELGTQEGRLEFRYDPEAVRAFRRDFPALQDVRLL